MSRKQIRLRAQRRAQKNNQQSKQQSAATKSDGPPIPNVAETVSADSEEQRKYPRINVPLLVEIQHPSLGRRRCVAKDISQGGVFVYIEGGADIRAGSNLKLTLLNSTSVYKQPTPTVDMAVVHTDEHGVGLSFANKTSEHLWESIEKFRHELVIGRDYFQIHVNPVVINERGQLLVVQQHGHWKFPGEYLVVGENWGQSIQRSLRQQFALKKLQINHILNVDSGSSEDLPEAATLQIFVLISGDASEFSLPASSKPANATPGNSAADNSAVNDSLPAHSSPTHSLPHYRSYRWLDSKRDLAEISFIDEQTRQIASKALDQQIAPVQ